MERVGGRERERERRRRRRRRRSKASSRQQLCPNCIIVFIIMCLPIVVT
jgi:hypothetical protein